MTRRKVTISCRSSASRHRSTHPSPVFAEDKKEGDLEPEEGNEVAEKEAGNCLSTNICCSDDAQISVIPIFRT